MVRQRQLAHARPSPIRIRSECTRVLAVVSQDHLARFSHPDKPALTTARRQLTPEQTQITPEQRQRMRENQQRALAGRLASEPPRQLNEAQRLMMEDNRQQALARRQALTTTRRQVSVPFNGARARATAWCDPRLVWCVC